MRPEEIRGLFQNAADFEEHTVEACGKRLTAFFIDGLTSGGDIAELVLRPLRENLRADERQTLLEQAETGAVWCALARRRSLCRVSTCTAPRASAAACTLPRMGP